VTATARAHTARTQTAGARARALRGTALALSLGSLAVVLAAWELLPRTGLVSRTILPTVTDTVGGLVRLFTSGYWWEDLRVTLVAVVIAWLIGCAVGIAIGIALGISPFIRTAITPYAVAVQALPKVVLAPLLIGWLGFGSESKIALAVAICFFPVWIDTMIGLSLPSADEFKLMTALRASRWQTFRKLQLPSAVPMIMVGVKHALLLAFTGVLVAEILAASAGGLGTLAKEFSLQLNMPLTVAVILVVVVIAVALVSVMDYVERKVVFWSEAARVKNS
jgi:NitT/TauT family transport system permease protein